MKQEINSSFCQEIKAILENARQSAYKAINFTIVWRKMPPEFDAH